MREWSDLTKESDRIIDQAMEEALARSNCTCGAVEIPGANHLEWCDEDEA